jgi:hypothetical protein
MPSVQPTTPRYDESPGANADPGEDSLNQSRGGIIALPSSTGGGGGGGGSGGTFRWGIGGCGCGCAKFSIGTNWCITTDVAPGTITVTVQQTNSSGPVVATGTANALGIFECVLPGSGTYYITASTSSSGYLNLPITVAVTVTGGAYSPSSTVSRLYPDQLTLTDPVVGAITLLPSGTLPPPGSGTGSYTEYIGTINYSYGAACGCAAGSVELQYLVQTCTSGNIVLKGLCPNGAPTDPNACPLTSGTSFQLFSCNFSGNGPQQSTCYPVNMTATNTLGIGTGNTGAFFTVYGDCNSANYTYTLTQ